MHPLDGASLKFARACDHLKTLDVAAQEFNKTDNCTLVPELNEQTGECVVRVKILKSPPMEWAILIGEIAHSLRSALDHMVWQLALTQVSTPYDKTEFPIFTDGALYNRNGIRSIQNLSSTQKAFVDSLQPYHAGDSAQEHPLWLLHELSNTDKHRLLPVANAAVIYGPYPPGEFELFFTGGDFSTVQQIKTELTMHAKLGEPMEDNAKVVTFKIIDLGLQKQVQVRAKATSNIVFGKGIKANSGRRVDKTLEAIFRQVDAILSDCAKQFF